MYCRDVMTRNVDCVSPNDTARVAAQRMGNEDVGFLPVCDQSKKVLGTLTDRDLALRILAAGQPPDTPVSQIMTHQVIACRPDDDLSQAESLMAKHQKSRILCLDNGGHLAGVISLADIVHKEDASKVSDMLREMKSERAA